MTEAWQQLSMNRILRLRSGDFITADEIEDEGMFPVFGGNGLRGFTDKSNTVGPIVLIGRQGAHCGNVHIADGQCWVSEHALRCMPEKTYDPSWLAYFLRHMNLNQFSVSAAQPGLSVDNLKTLPLALPPLETQRRIARFLDEKTAQIDGLIEKKRALLDRLAEKRQALITRAVTKGLNPTAPMKPSGIDWLGDIPAHWELKRLRFLVEGGTINGLYKAKDQFVDDGIAFVQMGEAFRSTNFTGGTEDRVLAPDNEIEKWGLREGDFLIARRSLVFEGSGKSVRVGGLTEDHLFESSMIRIRPWHAEKVSGFLSDYFQSAVGRAFFLAITKRVTISGIDSQQLKDVWIPMPPYMEAQAIWRECVDSDHAHEAIFTSVVQSIQRLEEYRCALVTAAVTGKLRLQAVPGEPALEKA